MEQASPELRAVQRLARQIRRFHETGVKNASIDTNLLPLIHQIAPSVDVREDESERTQPYPLEWVTSKTTFKTAIKNFRKDAERAGYNVPEASSSWSPFQSQSLSVSPGRQTRSQTAETERSDTKSQMEGTPATTVATDPSVYEVTNRFPGQAPQQAVPQEIVPQQSVSEPAAPQQAAPQQSVPQPVPQPVPQQSVPQPVPQPVPQQSVPQPVPQQSVPQPVPQPVPHQSVPQPVPQQSVTQQAIPQSAPPPPLQAAPQQSILLQGQQTNDPNTNPWPRFNAKTADIINSPAWRALQQECPLYGCDFADVKFRLEFRLKHEAVNDDSAGLLVFARNWIETCPEALELLEGDCYGDTDFKAAMIAYRSVHPRNLPSRRERDSRSRMFSEAPERDRFDIGFTNHLVEAYDGWDNIVLKTDPDEPENDEVVGKITLAVSHYLDVALPSLNPDNPQQERHILVKESEFVEEAKRFKGTFDGHARTFTKALQVDSLKGKKRENITILNYTSAEQEYDDRWPRTYA
ncbi:hypothetical protein CSUB01_07941, partial [Colletotrichum sublineola]